jgi:hypothetical protein
MQHVAAHEISGTRSRLAHTAASHRPVLSSGEANGWFLAKDLRSLKRPCTGHIFLIADAQFLVLQRPLFSSLRAAIYSPVPFIGCACSLTSSFDPVVLPI